MDNLTHSMVAVLLARTGLNRLAPGATALAVVAANLPDLDVARGLGGWLCYLEYHRGFTHAPFWLPLLAAAPLPLWWLWARKHGATRRDWGWAYLVSLLGMASHPLLDWLNSYGIRLGLPFSGAWRHLDWLNVVDLGAWALLAIFVAGPWLARLVDGEIGRTTKRARYPGRGMAVAGLLALGALIGLRGWLHEGALETLETRLYQGQAPRRTAALPSLANPWEWTGLVETERAWTVVPIHLTRNFDPDQGRVYLKPDVSAVRAVVQQTATARVFLDFAQCPLWRLTPLSEPDGGVLVSIHDLRFGLPEEGGFRVEIVLDGARRVIKERLRMEGPKQGGSR